MTPRQPVGFVLNTSRYRRGRTTSPEAIRQLIEIGQREVIYATKKPGINAGLIASIDLRGNASNEAPFNAGRLLTSEHSVIGTMNIDPHWPD